MAMQKVEQQKYDKAMSELKLKLESMTELERLAVPLGTTRMPDREDVLPHRFEDVSRLQSMLRDTDWSEYWSSIATTIGMAGDRKAALDLIDFIKSAPLPEGHAVEASAARLKAVTALAHTLYEQDIPEVLDFLQSLTDRDYVETLNMGPRAPTQAVRHRAYLSLAAAATDESLAMLEGLLVGAKAKKESMVVQSLSAGGAIQSDSEETVDEDIEMLEQYLSFGRNKRAGVVPDTNGKWMP